MSNFNAKTAPGASPREVSIPSEVRREHVGIREDDWYCYDCDGYVWGSRVEWDSKKCQRRRQEKGTSVNGMTDTPSTTMDREPSVFYTPPVSNEYTELKNTSFADVSPVPTYARSGEQAVLKRARRVRDRQYQREIQQGHREDILE